MLVVETDLGRDPDDLFALCYLISAGVEIDTLLITPGDPDQLAIGYFLSEYLDQNFKVIPSIDNRNKKSSGGVHYDLLRKYGYPLEYKSPYNALDDVILDNKDLFIIGPPTAIGSLLDFMPYTGL